LAARPTAEQAGRPRLTLLTSMRIRAAVVGA
jgi:hypothetical protein